MVNIDTHTHTFIVYMSVSVCGCVHVFIWACGGAQGQSIRDCLSLLKGESTLLSLCEMRSAFLFPFSDKP